MSQEFEKVSILKDADVSYSGSCKVPQYDLSKVGQPVPVPPAGDVEVQRYYLDATDGQKPCMVLDPQGFYCAHYHVTRLTAENASLKAERDAAVSWQATVRENSPLLIQLDALQADLTKARELLLAIPRRATNLDTRIDAFLKQSAPAAKGEHWKCWSCRKPVTLAECQEAGGECPHCRAEIHGAEELKL